MNLPTKQEWESLGFSVPPDLCSKPTNSSMNELIDNLINGNLKDARRMAGRFPAWQIAIALVARHKYSQEKAALTAKWLKGADCWQAACDAQ